MTDDFNKKLDEAAEAHVYRYASKIGRKAINLDIFKAGADWAKEELFKQTPELLKFGEMRQEIERLKEIKAELPKIPMESHEKTAHKAAVKWRELAEKLPRKDILERLKTYSNNSHFGSRSDEVCVKFEIWLDEFEKAKKEEI